MNEAAREASCRTFKLRLAEAWLGKATAGVARDVLHFDISSLALVLQTAVEPAERPIASCTVRKTPTGDGS